jgi:predicted amidohydrolase
MKIAAAAYPLDPLESWTDWREKLSRWVAEAAGQGADLLVFPEYAAMELACLAGPDAAGTVETAMRAVSERIEDADAAMAELAQAYEVHLLSGSAPVFAADEARPVNRVRLFLPDGRAALQDKLIPTRYEREVMDLAPGGPLRLFDTALGRIGVLICYDAEFPLLGRALVEAGAEILLVPSCTDALAGYWRVRIGAMARALEGQCVTVQAPTVGPAPWCPIVDQNAGAAAIYGPPDLGFPETGVLSEGAMNAPGWVFAEVDRDAIAHVRAEGRVRNLAHWDEQPPSCHRPETALFQ